MKLTQNQFYGRKIMMPREFIPGTSYISTDSQELFIYDESGLPILISSTNTTAPVITWGSIAGLLSSQNDLQNELNLKQNLLVSGTNIKTVNGNSLLGAGDLVITTGISDHTLLSNIGANSHSQIDSHISSVDNPHAVTKTQVGLSNVDNTTDLLKPISTATQTALDLKLDQDYSALTLATSPLAGTELLPIIQGGVTKRIEAKTLDNYFATFSLPVVALSRNITPQYFIFQTNGSQPIINTPTGESISSNLAANISRYSVFFVAPFNCRIDSVYMHVNTSDYDISIWKSQDIVDLNLSNVEVYNGVSSNQFINNNNVNSSVINKGEALSLFYKCALASTGTNYGKLFITFKKE